MVDEATDMTAFGGREKAVDMVYVRPVLLGSLMQNLYKTPKAQLCYFATPHRLHTAQLQVFQRDRIIRGTEFMGELPLPVLALMGNTGMHPCQGASCLTAMARTTHFPRQRPRG